MIKRQSYYYLNDRWRDWDSDITKALIEDVVAVSKEEIKKPTKKLKVLDVGCGGGNYSFAIEKKVSEVVSVEPYKEAFLQAKKNKERLNSKIVLKNLLIENFKTDKKFDLVMSIATLEHMPKPKESFESIFSKMYSGGIIYLTVPNKLWPIEVHYKLPFLSWLPLKVANKYVRLFGLANTYEDSSYAMTYWGIRSFFNSFPCSYEFRIPDANSAYLGLGDRSFGYRAVKNVGIALIKKWPFFWMFSKGFILVIKKK